jgi:hypothetical protein
MLEFKVQNEHSEEEIGGRADALGLQHETAKTKFETLLLQRVLCRNYCGIVAV